MRPGAGDAGDVDVRAAGARLAEGRAALAAGDEARAALAFEAAAAAGAGGDAAFGLAQAHYLARDHPAAVQAWTQAYAAYRAGGDRLGGAAAARMLSWVHGNVRGDWAVAGGWLARATRLLEEAGEDCLERGWIEVLGAGAEADPTVREERYLTAVAIARRFGDADLEFEASSWIGFEHVLADRFADGMVRLDEAMAAIAGGEVNDWCVIEGAVCAMFLACERAQDVGRAEQWMRTVEDLRGRRKFAVAGSFCRAHYGAILTAAGRWAEAEAELTAAARMFEGGSTRMEATALVRLADLRVRQGRLEEAARLLQGLDQDHDAVRPLAALHLAHGRVAAARDLLERALPPENTGSAAGPLLALLVDVELADGHVDAARAAADRLVHVATEQPTPYLRAAAAMARGKVCVASGDGQARACLQDALSLFSLAQMPVELARARLELARALVSDRPEVAITEATNALAAFERLEAARDADAAAALLRTLGAAGRAGSRTGEPLTNREKEVLALLGHGLSNPEIAARLFISRKTVEHHVSRILAKLRLRSRAEAAAHAARSAPPARNG